MATERYLRKNDSFFIIDFGLKMVREYNSNAIMVNSYIDYLELHARSSLQRLRWLYIFNMKKCERGYKFD